MAQQKQQRAFLKTVRASNPKNDVFQSVNLECYDLELATLLDSNKDPQPKIKEGKITWIANMSIKDFEEKYANKKVEIKMTNGDVAKLNFNANNIDKDNLIKRFVAAQKIVLEFAGLFIEMTRGREDLNLFAKYPEIKKKIVDVLKVKQSGKGYDFSEEPEIIVKILKNIIEEFEEAIKKSKTFYRLSDIRKEIKKFTDILEKVVVGENNLNHYDKITLYRMGRDTEFKDNNAGPLFKVPEVRTKVGRTGAVQLVCDSQAFLDAIINALFPGDISKLSKWDTGGYNSFISRLKPEELDSFYEITKTKPFEFIYQGKTCQLVIKKTSKDLSNKVMIDVLEVKLSTPTVQPAPTVVDANTTVTSTQTSITVPKTDLSNSKIVKPNFIRSATSSTADKDTPITTTKFPFTLSEPLSQQTTISAEQPIIVTIIKSESESEVKMICSNQTSLNAIIQKLFPNSSSSRSIWDRDLESFTFRVSPREWDDAYKKTKNSPLKFTYQGKNHQFVFDKKYQYLDIVSALDIKNANQKNVQQTEFPVTLSEPPLPELDFIKNGDKISISCNNREFLAPIISVLGEMLNESYILPDENYIFTINTNQLDRLFEITRHGYLLFTYQEKTYEFTVNKKSQELNELFDNDVLKIKLSSPANTQQTSNFSGTIAATDTEITTTMDMPVLETSISTTNANTITTSTLAKASSQPLPQSTPSVVPEKQIDDFQHMQPKIEEIESTEEEPPESFMCPIGFEIMKDPVILTTNELTYERENIEKWCDEKGTCPTSRKPITRDNIISNRTLKDAIEDWNNKQVSKKSKSITNDKNKFGESKNLIWARSQSTIQASSVVSDTEALKKEVASIGVFLLDKLKNQSNFADITGLIKNIMEEANLERFVTNQTQPPEGDADAAILLKRFQDILLQLPAYENKENHIEIYNLLMEDIPGNNNFSLRG